MDKDGIICCPCLCFLFPHFLSAKQIFPLILSIQNQKLWKIADKEIVGIAQNCPVQTAQKCPIYTLPTYT